MDFTHDDLDRHDAGKSHFRDLVDDLLDGCRDSFRVVRIREVELITTRRTYILLVTQQGNSQSPTLYEQGAVPSEGGLGG